MSDKKRLAVIPARGGSKRIPKKNIKRLGAKPLLAYTVRAALESKLFSHIIVSTDAEDIAEVAKDCGASVLKRSRDLADDHTPASKVTLDVLDSLEPLTFEHVCQLMPNCPFRTAADIKASFDDLLKTSSEAQLSVTRYGWLNPWWAHKRNDDGSLEPLFPEALKSRSQDLAELYCPSGAIWWAEPAALKRAGSFYTGMHSSFYLPWQRALDIDDEDDWRMAEALLKLS